MCGGEEIGRLVSWFEFWLELGVCLEVFSVCYFVGVGVQTIQESGFRGRLCEFRIFTVRFCFFIIQVELVGRVVCFIYFRLGFSFVFQKMVLVIVVCFIWEGIFFLIKEIFNFLGVGVEQIYVCLYQNYYLECQLGIVGVK